MNFRGFTLIELVVILVVTGILAATIMPRFANKGEFDQAGFRNQLVAVLQFSRKVAVAQRRNVCVAVDGAGITVTVDRDLPETAFVACEDPVPLPGNQTACGSNRICAPSGVSLGAASFRFDALGRPLVSGASAALAFTVSGGANIAVEQETGYVH